MKLDSTNNSNKFGMSVGILTKLFRITGCDFVNVGLKASNIYDKSLSLEIINAAAEEYNLKFQKSIPVFTGGLTPRMTYNIINKYSDNIILHIKKPILRNGLNERLLKRNTLALFEAIDLAQGTVCLDSVLAKENHTTVNFRSYEEEFGKT